MTRRTKAFLLWGGILLALVIVINGSYSAWNASNPANTCARCHEIAPSHETWLSSAHAGVTCIDCHGAALSSFKSFREKMGMVFTHFTSSKAGKKVWNEEIKLTEQQILDISTRCAECHQVEHAQWAAGGHSATYAEIYEDPTHNAAERPYDDCLRCHGMFYDQTLDKLMDLTSLDDPSAWKIYNREQADKPTMPCLACHQMHTPNPVSTRSQEFDTPKNMHYERAERSPKTALYMRADKVWLRTDHLIEPYPPMIDENGREITVADDPSTRLCLQCHSPNTSHHAGTLDDKTPMGVHEGLSCISCHKGHSYDTRSSCLDCHPALSNCGIDVAEMNTTYKDPESPYDIHKVSCTDCHAQMKI